MKLRTSSAHEWEIRYEGGKPITYDYKNGLPVSAKPSTARDIAQWTLRQGAS